MLLATDMEKELAKWAPWLWTITFEELEGLAVLVVGCPQLMDILHTFFRNSNI